MRIKNLINLLLKMIRPQSEQRFNDLLTNHKPQNKALFFTHVPKTGGTSFIVFIDRFFPSQSIHKPQLWWEVGDLKAAKSKQYGLFRGHLGGQSGSLFSDKDIDYITLVRDPVKLAYSTYQFVKRIKETALHDLVVQENMSFETFLAHPKTQHLVSDRLIHNLCYGTGVHAEDVDFDINEQSFPNLRKMLNKGMQSKSSDEKLAMASQFLERCLWVGVLEDFDHAVRLLCYKMSWPPMGASQKLNTHKKSPQISDEAYALAQELNANDMLLYQNAKERFDKELMAMYSDLKINSEAESRLLDLAIDEHYQNNYLKDYDQPLANEIYYDCSQVLLGSQWHRREWSEIDKSYFRWSGPGETAYLDFWVKPQKYQVTIKIMDAIHTEFLDGLRITVNGHQQSIRYRGKGRGRVLSFTLSKKHIKSNGLLRLFFQGEKLMPHQEVFGFDDERLVGLALRSVAVEKIEV